MDQGFARLGARIKAERIRRWPTRRGFAQAAGISVRVVSALENGTRTNFSAETIAAVETALGWELGDAERVRHGLEPNRQWDPGLMRLITLWPTLNRETKRTLVYLAEESVRDE